MSLRPFLSVVVALLLVLGTGAVVAQKGPGGQGDERRAPTATERDDDGSGRGPGGSGSDKADAEASDEDSGDDGRRGRPMVGRGFTQERSQGFSGDYVTFSYAPGGIPGFVAGGVTYFSASVDGGRLGTHHERDDVGVRGGGGSHARVETPTYRFDAHDNPSATATLRANGTITLTFPNGTTLEAEENHARVTLPTGERALVSAPHDLAVAGTSLTASDRVHFMLDRAKGAFDPHRAEIGKAVGQRKIGAEVSLSKHEDRLREDVVQFENVTVTTQHRPGNVTLILDGHGLDGRVIVVNVDPDVLGSLQRENLRFLFDNATMRAADDLRDVLDPDDDGLQPEYHLVHDADGFQLIVSVPHYSVHTLSIVAFLQEVPPSIVVGVLAGTMGVAAGGAFLFRRRAS